MPNTGEPAPKSDKEFEVKNLWAVDCNVCGGIIAQYRTEVSARVHASLHRGTHDYCTVVIYNLSTKPK